MIVSIQRWSLRVAKLGKSFGGPRFATNHRLIEWFHPMNVPAPVPSQAPAKYWRKVAPAGRLVRSSHTGGRALPRKAATTQPDRRRVTGVLNRTRTWSTAAPMDPPLAGTHHGCASELTAGVVTKRPWSHCETIRFIFLIRRYRDPSGR